MARSVHSAVVLAVNLLSPLAVATLLGFNCDLVLSLLGSVQSLLTLHDDIDHPVRPFHELFPDFIADSTHCANTQFYISPDHRTGLFL